MAGKGRVVYYSTEATLRAILKGSQMSLNLKTVQKVIICQLLHYPMMRMQETRLTFLLNLKISPEEVVVEVEV